MNKIPELSYKNFPVNGLKVLDEKEGIVEMFVSVFGNKDSYNERMMFGCYEKSLSQRMPNGLFMHNWEQPVAKTLQAVEIGANDPRLPNEIKQYGGLYIKAQYNLKTSRGHDAFSDIEGGYIKEFSVGYKEEQSLWNKGLNCKDVTEAFLYEWSSVVAGANPLTVVVGTKALGESKGKELFESLKSEYFEDAENCMAFSACGNMLSRLYWELLPSCCFDDAMSKADRILMFRGAMNEAMELCSKALESLLENEAQIDEMKTESDARNSIKTLLTFREGKNTEKGLDALSELAKHVQAKVSAIGELRAKDRNKEGRVFSTANTNTITENISSLRNIANDFEDMLASSKPVKVDMQLLIQKRRAKKLLQK